MGNLTSGANECQEGRIDHRSYTHNAVVKLEPEKNSGLNGIRIHDLCDTGAVLRSGLNLLRL